MLRRHRSPGAAALYLGFVLFHDIDHRGWQIFSYIWLKISEVQYQWTINIMSATIKATSCHQFPPLNDNMKSTFQQGQDSLCLDYFSYFNLSPIDASSVLDVFTIIIALQSRVRYTFPRSQDGVLTLRAEQTASPEREEGNCFNVLLLEKILSNYKTFEEILLVIKLFVAKKWKCKILILQYG